MQRGSVCCRGLPHLRREFTAAEQRLRRRPDIIRACSQQVGHLENFTRTSLSSLLK
ncbi:MAG: hypothetical protein JO250_24590 [Armatimonadetes bacterium]|nr:hypothetical protein [Armatimonadota bacterium]